MLAITAGRTNDSVDTKNNGWCDGRVDQQPDTPQSRPISTALFVDSDVLNRFGRVLRYLIVGLVDQAISVRLVSSDARIESLTLGPVQTVVHERISWPFRQRKLDHLSDALSHQPPTIVHAFSGEVSQYAGALARIFDSDFFLHVSSMADADAIGRIDFKTVAKFLAVSEPLVGVLENQLAIPPDQIKLIRPGIQVSEDISCFADPNRAPTLLCTSNLSKESGVDRLIVAMDRLRKQNLFPMLFVLGEGRYESGLRALVRKRKLESQITFANPLGDTLSTLRSADIFVHPSLDTVFTSDTLTALGTGTMVISCQGVGDHLRHGETALVCDQPMADSLAKHLAAALTDREESRKIARNGLAYAREHHGVSAMAERTAETYRAAALAHATFQMNR